MLLKDHVDCRFLYEGTKLKRARACQIARLNLFHNHPFCWVGRMLADIIHIWSHQRAHSWAMPGPGSRGSRELPVTLLPIQPRMQLDAFFRRAYIGIVHQDPQVRVFDSCFLSHACTVAWGYSTPHTEICICFCWTSWGFCQSIFSRWNLSE